MEIRKLSKSTTKHLLGVLEMDVKELALKSKNKNKNMQTKKKIALGVVAGIAVGTACWWLMRDTVMININKQFTNLTDAEKASLKAKVDKLTDAERKIANSILEKMIAKQKPIPMTVEEQTVMEIKLGISMKNYL